MIVIINHGLGNLKGILHKIEKGNIKAKISNDPNDIITADKLILPGVGSFRTAIENMRKLSLVDVLNNKVVIQKTPILGVCLGMQLFTKFSEEGNCEGLGWIDGIKKKFIAKNRLKVPHMGWNKLEFIKKSSWFNGIDDIPYFYFVHSYFVTCHDKNDVLATTFYDHDFLSVINRENIFGVQFHTEKSHQQGIRLLHNFCNL